MKLYVKAKNKSEANGRIAAGLPVYGENFSIFGDGGTYKLDANLAKGTVISIFEKTVGGSPYAKAYGTWNGSKIA